MLKKSDYAQAINDEILEKLSLKNRYAWVNNCLQPILTTEQFAFFRKVQRFCLKFEKKFQRPLVQGYGLTEAAPVVSLNPIKGKRKPESVGRILPSQEAKVVDALGRPLPEGESGELIIRGPNVMRGYYRLDQENSKTL